jgi:CrcB protein
MQIIAVAIGGAIGAVLRFVVSGAAYAQFGVAFPIGTFLVNMIGCLLIGFLAQVFEEIIVPPTMRLLILTGTLGAFTTFSTYGLETVKLWQGGELRLALLNIVASNVLGILFVVLGFVLARTVLTGIRP